MWNRQATRFEKRRVDEEGRHAHERRHPAGTVEVVRQQVGIRRLVIGQDSDLLRLVDEEDADIGEPGDWVVLFCVELLDLLRRKEILALRPLRSVAIEAK